MTIVVVAIHADGALAQRLTDETATPQHETYDVNGTTLLTTVDITEEEREILRVATPQAAPARPVLSGAGAPTIATGTDGDMYVDINTNLTYGPKANGAWPVGATVELARA